MSTGPGSQPRLRCLPMGREGLLVELADAADVPRLYTELQHRAPDGIVDIVPAARTVLVTGPGVRALADELPHWRLSEELDAQAEYVELPVVYDGADLAAVAHRCEMSIEQVIRCHSDTEYRVAFCGFAPGFAYLQGLPPALNLPRRDSPRSRVPAGSVAIAGPYSGVYPRELPGGWHLLGRTRLSLWDLTRNPPARLRPGMRVRFVPEPGT